MRSRRLGACRARADGDSGTRSARGARGAGGELAGTDQGQDAGQKAACRGIENRIGRPPYTAAFRWVFWPDAVGRPDAVNEPGADRPAEVQPAGAADAHAHAATWLEQQRYGCSPHAPAIGRRIDRGHARENPGI